MGQSAGHITRSFNQADVDSLLVEKTGDLGTLVVSGKINKRSRYKPYAFGSYDTLLVDQNGKENPILKEHNFGMRPATFGWNPYRALPWDQWEPPKPEEGKANLRFTDMDHYYQFAAGGISTARIYTNNPNDDRKVMLGGSQEGTEGRIKGETVFSFNTDTEISPHEFCYPNDNPAQKHPMTNFRFTLLFGPVEGNLRSGFESKPWVSQCKESISELVGSQNVNNDTREILLDLNRSAIIGDDTSGNMSWLAILCLAPPMEVDSDGRFVKWTDYTYDEKGEATKRSSSSLEFGEMRLVSLDMWDELTVREQTVLHATSFDQWQNADPSKLPYEIIPIASTREYLLDPDETKEPFTCEYVYGEFHDDGEGEHSIMIDCSPFSLIWFAGYSKIGRLRQVVKYEIYNSNNIRVRSGECEVSEVYIGTPYNPTNAPYNIGFEEELVGEEVYIQTLAPGDYTLSLSVRVEQVGDTVVYKNGKGYRQEMHDFYWEGEDMSFETDNPFKAVWAKLNWTSEESVDFPFTVFDY